MKKTFTHALALLASLFFIPVSSTAQTPLAEGNGPAIENCYASMSDHILLRNDDKAAIFYLHTYSTNPKLQHQGIVTFNKQTKTAYTEQVSLPAGFRPLHVRAIGADYFGYYYRYNPDNQTFEYSTAQFTQKKSCDGIRSVTPNNRLSLDIRGRGEILKYTATSPDQSMFAVTFVIPNENNQAPYFYCYIYDNAGKEVWYDKFLPTIEGNRFTIQDIALSDKGELLLLVCAGKGKIGSMQTRTMQLFKCTHNNITSISENLDFGIINSMKMLRLKNGNIFIGGYYNESLQSNTSGIFNFIVKDEPLRVAEKNHEAIDQRSSAVYEGLRDEDYLVKCDYLFETKDQVVVMLGEQYASIQAKETAFTHHTNDILCHKFTFGGTSLGMLRVNKHLSAPATSIVTTHDEGERIGSYLTTAKKPLERTPTFHNLSLSYSPIFINNELFVLYADRFSNFAEEATKWEAARIGSDEMCVALTKLDYSVDKKVVMAPDKSARVFHDIWCIDGKDIYFGMNGKKGYTLEMFRLDKQWSWDK